MRGLFLKDGKLRSGWRLALYLVVALGAWALGVRFVVRPLLGRNDNILVSVRSLATISLLLVTGVGVALLFARLLDQRPFASLGYSLHRKWGRELAIGALVGAVVPILVLLAQLAVGAVTVQWAPASRQITAQWMALFLLVLTVTAFAEEFFFRGYLLQTLVQGLGVWPAVVLPGVLFGAMHLLNKESTLAGGASIAVIGILFGAVCVRTRSLWCMTGCHFTANLFQGVVASQPVSGTVVERSLFLVRPTGPVVFTGGSFGQEATIFMAPALLLVLVPLAYSRLLAPAQDADRSWQRWVIGRGAD